MTTECPIDIEINGTKYQRKDTIPEPGDAEMFGGYANLIGRNVFVRTVTFHYTGKLRAVYAHELVLDQAAWIADSGRFADALKNGSLNEVEPYPDQVIINRDTVTDICLWPTKLPRDQK